jgi:hypothetical protein
MSLRKVAGTAYFKLDGVQYALQGSMTINFSEVQREAMVGADGVHGFKETPQAPSIAVTLTRTPECSLETLRRVTDSTITAECSDGRTYVLTEAFQSGELSYAVIEGTLPVTFHGRTCREIA